MDRAGHARDRRCASAQVAGPGLPTPAAPLDRTPASARAQVERAAAGDRQRLNATAARLQPQRPGVVDAYVLAIALDSDPVFAREAREAGRVLARRYDAERRTLVLAGPDGHGIDPLPRGTPATFAAALADVAGAMDKSEDALVLYVTAHGSRSGVAYRRNGEVLATVTPGWLENTLRKLGIRNRLLIVSACFSGVFVPVLASPEGAVITAAASDRTSFGCAADNDWTFFGDAFVNHAMRRPIALKAGFTDARAMVGKWEAEGRLEASNPQASFGEGTAAWLRPLEDRMPREPTEPVGQPAAAMLAEVSKELHARD